MDINVDPRLYKKNSVGTITRITARILDNPTVEKKMLERKAKKSWVEPVQWNGVKYIVTCKIEEEGILSITQIRQSSPKQRYKIKRDSR